MSIGGCASATPDLLNRYVIKISTSQIKNNNAAEITNPIAPVGIITTLTRGVTNSKIAKKVMKADIVFVIRSRHFKQNSSLIGRFQAVTLFVQEVPSWQTALS